MERRRFFKQAVTGLLGIGALQGSAVSSLWSASDSDSHSTGHGSGLTLRKAVKLHLLNEDLPLQERFVLLRDLGFDGVEVRSPTDQWSQEALVQAQDETGLSIHGVLNPGNWSEPLSSPDPDVRSEGIDILKEAIADAGAYGASTVLLVPAVVDEDVSYDDAWDRSQRAIRKVLPTAEKHDITIVFENVWNHFLLSPMEFARYIDEFQSEYVGAYLDIGNTLTYGWPDQWARILGDRVVKVDVKDRTRDRYDGRGQAARVKLGDGSCDWEAVQEALDDIGYSGWATAEVSGGDRERLREISSRMSQVLPFS